MLPNIPVIQGLSCNNSLQVHPEVNSGERKTEWSTLFWTYGPKTVKIHT